MTPEQELDAAHEALPDAFERGAGSLADKINAYREFASGLIHEVQQCCDILPDSLNRPLSERIKILLERADREAKLAVELRQQLESVCGGPTLHKLSGLITAALASRSRRKIGQRCDICHCNFDTFEDFHEHLYWHDSKGLVGKPPRAEAEVRAPQEEEE